MTEKESQGNLPFEHPEVQGLLRVTNRLIIEKGLASKWLQQTDSHIRQCVTAQSNDRIDRTKIIEAMKVAVSAETPFAGYGNLGQYETLEEFIYLTKVDGSGRVIPGSLGTVGIISHDSQNLLKLEPEFTVADLAMVKTIVDSQNQVPWAPIIEEGYTDQTLGR